MNKFSPLVVALVAMMASSASAFVPSKQMSTRTITRGSEKARGIESILNMSDQNVSDAAIVLIECDAFYSVSKFYMYPVF